MASLFLIVSRKTKERLTLIDHITTYSSEMFPCSRYSRLEIPCVVSSKHSRACEACIRANIRGAYYVLSVSMAEYTFINEILTWGLSSIRAIH